MKSIKDTKLGQWLKEKAPKVLDKVGDLLPDSGTLGIIKNLISIDDPEAPPLSAEERLEFNRLSHELEIELLRDVQNARAREIDFVKSTGHMDYFMYLFGFIAMLLFAYTIYISSTGSIATDMREIFIEGRSRVSDIVMLMAGYYWGSSASSRVKDMLSRR